MSHPDGKCLGCKETRENHRPTGEFFGWDKNSAGHIALSKCSWPGCTYPIEGSEREPHDYEYKDNKNGTHYMKCRDCEYEVKEEHDYDNDEGTETGAAFVLEIGTELGAVEIDESCTKCSALASAAENGCEHTYVEKNDANQHWEECTKCGYYKRGSLEEHGYTTYTDNGDATHSSICTKCEYKQTEEHYFVDGVCQECEAKQVQECEHSYVFKSDDTKHWAQCSKCNDIKADTAENHEYGKYFDNNDGTHSAACETCVRVITEEHEENCDKCGIITPPNDSENGDEGGDNKEEDKGNTTTPEAGEKEDNTIADVIIPAAGSPMFIALVIVILGVVIGIIKLKLKSYKDI